MDNVPHIDVAFDFRTDTPPGKDPDALSPTLRRYHHRLWSKPLPSGEPFALSMNTPGAYLHHASDLGSFRLSSDAVIPSFSRARELRHVMSQIPEEEIAEFNTLGYTIGGMMVFPSYQVDRKMTINAQRGCHPRVKDRFDLTVECIRRHYIGDPSPLSDTLARYASFFDLFGDFAGYVEFFLLQDLVDTDGRSVRFSMPFAGFTESPLPLTVPVYREYRERAMEFIESRNQRIAAETSVHA